MTERLNASPSRRYGDLMNTYYYDKYNGKKWVQEKIVAKNINNVRLKLLNEDYLKHGILIKKKTGDAPGAPFKELGILRAVQDGEVNWANKKGTYRVSKKTGALLDWDKYWRYV